LSQPGGAVIRALLHSLLFFPSRAIEQTPEQAGLAYRELALQTEDGERLHGWRLEARAAPIGHILFCHGNGGNIGDRLLFAALLTRAGFDVLLFDYRGYGRSSGRPSEQGTYRDARAARACLLDQPGVDASRTLLLGESLGGAVALDLALAHPPAGLVLLSAFTSVRAMARLHYPYIPATVVPDAYPNLRRIGELRAPLLVLHGEGDEIVPVAHARELADAAPQPKHLVTFPGVGHADVVPLAGEAVTAEIAAWARGRDLAA